MDLAVIDHGGQPEASGHGVPQVAASGTAMRTPVREPARSPQDAVPRGRLDLAVLLSGSGRTLDNFHQRIAAGTMRGRIRVVIANTAAALGLEKARNYGYPAFAAPDSAAINAILKDYPVDLVLLAGFLKLYTPPPHLARAVLNIHPSLIPAFCGPGMYGMKVHRAAQARGVKVSGCTVHFANEQYDEGPIVVQKCVAIAEGDTPEAIAVKVFAAECEAYPEAVNLVAERGISAFWPT